MTQTEITYNFWDKQPLCKIITEFNIESIKLTEDFIWDNSIDLADDIQCNEVVTFLNKHYAEDINEKFRIKVTTDFIKWAVIGNRNPKHIHCLALRVAKSNLMVGFICSYPITVQIQKNKLSTTEVNFLCVHKKLRGKNVCTLLIKELINMCVHNNLQHAYFTSNKLLPKHFASCQFYHRALNVDLLYKTKFINLNNNGMETMLSDVKRTLSLPSQPINKNFVKLQEDDIDSAYAILTDYLSRYSFYPIFSKDEFKNHFYNNKIVTTYVNKDVTGVTDIISYYKSQLTVLNSPYIINQAQLYYYSSINETPFRLIKDMMIIAKSEGMDVFSAFNIMENINVLKELHFELGTGTINSYLYNYNCSELNNNVVAKIPL